jgi:myosin heavy subunit
MMETIRIRQQGYAFRQPHKEFFKRYLPLEPSCRTLQQLVDILSNRLNVHDESWQVGTTKLFIKRVMSEKLDRLLLVRYTSCSRRIQRAWKKLRRNLAATAIQKVARKFIEVRKFKKIVKSTLKIQAVVRGRKYAKLHQKKLR